MHVIHHLVLFYHAQLLWQSHMCPSKGTLKRTQLHLVALTQSNHKANPPRPCCPTTAPLLDPSLIEQYAKLH
jgi:hypothetical protein